MDEAQIRIEVSRVTNLVAGFGWTKVEEKISAGEIRIVLLKVLPEEKATAA